MDNRFNMSYVKSSHKKIKALERSRVPLIGEFDSGFYEVKSEKSRITDSIPGESIYLLLIFHFSFPPVLTFLFSTFELFHSCKFEADYTPIFERHYRPSRYG